MNCKNCGAPISVGTNNCPNCGSGIENNNQTINRPPIPGVSNQANSHKIEGNLPKGPGFNIIAGVEENKPQNAPAPNNDNSGVGMIMMLLFFVALAVGGYTLYNKMQDKPLYEPEVEEKVDNDDKENDTEVEKPVEEEKDNYLDNVKFIEEVKLFDGSIMLLYKNNNTELVNVDLKIEFYGKDGTLLGDANDNSFASARGEFYFIISSNSVRKGYDNYKTNLTVTPGEGLTRLDLLISDFVIRDSGSKFSIQYPNKTNQSIDSLKMCVTYYNVNDVVQISCSTKKNIEATGTASFEFEYGSMKTKGMVYTNYVLSFDAYTSSVVSTE